MRFRFTIRDLLWLTALAAVFAAWWLDHRFQVERYQSSLPPQIVVYPITTATPNAMLRALQKTMDGVPEVRLMVDTSSNCVVALARQQQQDIIHRIINTIEGTNVTPLPKIPQSPRPKSTPGTQP
jgi:hypothetical protein